MKGDVCMNLQWSVFRRITSYNERANNTQDSGDLAPSSGLKLIFILLVHKNLSLYLHHLECMQKKY